jgi:hypothetical protein
MENLKKQLLLAAFLFLIQLIFRQIYWRKTFDAVH